MVVIRIVTPTEWAMEVSRTRQQVKLSLHHHIRLSSPAPTMGTTVTARVVINMVAMNPMALVEVATPTTITTMAAQTDTAVGIILEAGATRDKLRVRRETSRCSRTRHVIRLTTRVPPSNTCSKCRGPKIRLAYLKVGQQQ